MILHQEDIGKEIVSIEPIDSELILLDSSTSTSTLLLHLSILPDLLVFTGLVQVPLEPKPHLAIY